MIDIMAKYLIDMANPNSLHSIDLQKNLQVQVYIFVMPSDLLTCPFDSFTYPSAHILKTSIISFL